MKTTLFTRLTTNRRRHPALKTVMLVLASLLTFGGQGAAVWAMPQMAQAAQTSEMPLLTCNQTLAVTEGPYWRAGSPERSSLIESGMQGARLVVTGYVYDTNCQPVANAWLDFWQANYSGAYDNTGYNLRGHQYADQSGHYRLETIVPGEYPGRTVHIHVKVQAPNGPVLTTQLFFPDVADNSNDGIYSPSLVVALQNVQGVKTGTFNFVVSTSAKASLPPASSHTFKETGFAVSGRFWDAWQGGRTFQDSLYINGYPITNVREEVSPTDGKSYQTQWFERARFEAHPENQAPNDILFGLLGVAAAQGRQNETPFKPVANPGGREQWFSQTGHTLGNLTSDGGRAIITFWSQRGDVRQFGLPISEPFMETNKADGTTHFVQYFERQRFEYHPEYKGTPYEILLGRLGAEQVKR